MVGTKQDEFPLLLQKENSTDSGPRLAMYLLTPGQGRMGFWVPYQCNRFGVLI